VAETLSELIEFNVRSSMPVAVRSWATPICPTLVPNLPTLLVRGHMSDLVSEKSAQEFVQLRPDGNFLDVSRAGHMVPADTNDLFMGAVKEFLDTLT